MRIIMLLLTLSLSCGDSTETTAIAPDSNDVAFRAPRCSQYVVWELVAEPGFNEAVEDACLDHHYLTDMSPDQIEAIMFAAVPVILSRPGQDRLIELEDAGFTVRIHLAYVDSEVVYLAIRRLLEEAP